MKAILKWSRILNEFFIKILLVPFYFLVFGISFLVFHLVNLINQKTDKNSFWKKDQKELKNSDFESAY